MLSEPLLAALQDELRKEASLASLVASNAGRLKNIGSLGGIGAAVGAAGGGVLGGVRGYQHAQEQGQSGVGGALQGAVGGALTGGAVGGLAGGVAGGVVKGSYGHLAENSASARFGQRQVHSLTGMLSPSEVQGVRGGAYDAKQHLDNMVKARDAASTAVQPPGMLRRAGESMGLKPQTATPRDIAQRAVDRAEKAHGAAQKAQDMNLTSMPGYLRSMRSEANGGHGALNTLRTSAEEQIRTQPLMTAAMVGAPIAVGALAKPHEGEGRGEAIGRGVGMAAGAVAGGVMPIAGNAAMGAGAEHIGAWAGRGVDRLRGPRLPHAPTPTMEPAESQNTPTERVLSPSAMGQGPES